MKYVIFLAGLAAVFLLAFLVSNDRKKIKYKPIVIMLVLQFIFTYILLNTSIGLTVIKAISTLFEKLLGYASDGVNFVFGGLANEAAMPFFLNV
ncbi:NupC/NupG family nucleoside CNT transporter, partial [Fictibacillus aquaticus]